MMNNINQPLASENKGVLTYFKLTYNALALPNTNRTPTQNHLSLYQHILTPPNVRLVAGLITCRLSNLSRFSYFASQPFQLVNRGKGNITSLAKIKTSAN